VAVVAAMALAPKLALFQAVLLVVVLAVAITAMVLAAQLLLALLEIMEAARQMFLPQVVAAQVAVAAATTQLEEKLQPAKLQLAVVVVGFFQVLVVLERLEVIAEVVTEALQMPLAVIQVSTWLLAAAAAVAGALLEDRQMWAAVLVVEPLHLMAELLLG